MKVARGGMQTGLLVVVYSVAFICYFCLANDAIIVDYSRKPMSLLTLPVVHSSRRAYEQKLAGVVIVQRERRGKRRETRGA